MATTRTLSRGSKLAADESLKTGVEKFFTSYAALTIGSSNVKPADIVKMLQDRIDTSKAVLVADAARTAAVKADRDKRAQTAAFVQSLRRTVVGMFTESPDTLATFGLQAPKPHKTTVATKAAAVAKNKATREARGTLGSQQKKSVKGTVATAAPATSSKASASQPAAPSTAVGTPSQGSLGSPQGSQGTGGAAPPHAT